MRPFPPCKSYFFPLLLRKISVVYSAWAACGDPVVCTKPRHLVRMSSILIRKRFYHTLETLIQNYSKRSRSLSSTRLAAQNWVVHLPTKPSNKRWLWKVHPGNSPAAKFCVLVWGSWAFRRRRYSRTAVVPESLIPTEEHHRPTLKDESV